jgi:hypothetical protein
MFPELLNGEVGIGATPAYGRLQASNVMSGCTTINLYLSEAFLFHLYCYDGNHNVEYVKML